MAMDMSADNRAMLSSSEFGATSFTLNGVGIQGIYDAAYYQVIGVDGSVESSQPAVICVQADTIGVKHEDIAVIDGKTFYVVGIKPDGTGMTELALEVQ